MLIAKLSVEKDLTVVTMSVHIYVTRPGSPISNQNCPTPRQKCQNDKKYFLKKNGVNDCSPHLGQEEREKESPVSDVEQHV